MSEQNKATAKRFYDAWSSGDLDAFDEILAPDYQDHDTQNPNAVTAVPRPPGPPPQMYREAFSDSRFEIRPSSRTATTSSRAGRRPVPRTAN